MEKPCPRSARIIGRHARQAQALVYAGFSRDRVSLPAIARFAADTRTPTHPSYRNARLPRPRACRVDDTQWRRLVRRRAILRLQACRAPRSVHNVTLALTCAASATTRFFPLAPRRTARQLRVDAGIFRGVVGAGRYHAADTPAWPIAADDTAGRYEGLAPAAIVHPEATVASLLEYRLTVPDAEASW